MKLLKLLLVFGLLFSLTVGEAAAKKFVFSVLASNGKVEVKEKSGSWKKLKTGAKLFEGDKVKISRNAYLGLVHKSGKALQVKEANEYSVKELAGKISKSGSVTGRFTQYVLDEMQETDNLFADDKYNMDVTGSVERGSEIGMPFLGKDGMFRVNSPRKINLMNQDLTLKWFSVEGAKTYTVHITDRFDRPVKSFDVKDTVYNFKPAEFKLETDVYYFWYVTVSDDDKKKSEDGCFMVYSDQSAKALNDSLLVLEEELGDMENPVSQALVAYFYEKNNLVDKADEAYKKAVELSEGMEDYKNMYDRFRKRVNLDCCE